MRGCVQQRELRNTQTPLVLHFHLCLYHPCHPKPEDDDFEKLKRMGRLTYVGRKGRERILEKRSKNSKGEDCIEIAPVYFPGNCIAPDTLRMMGNSKYKPVKVPIAKYIEMGKKWGKWVARRQNAARAVRNRHPNRVRP